MLKLFFLSLAGSQIQFMAFPHKDDSSLRKINYFHFPDLARQYLALNCAFRHAKYLFYIGTAVSQCLNRQANLLYSRPETILEPPLNPPLLPPTVIENQNFPTTLTYPNPTTIITDCTPSVCQNLVNTIQLMIICNLLRNTKEGSELASQIASMPIVNELMTSPVFSCGCSNPLSNTPMPSIVSPKYLPTNLNSRLPIAPNLMSNINGNPLFGNIMNMLS